MTIADLSMMGYRFHGDVLSVPLNAFANIGSWMERVEALPGGKHPYELMPSAPKAG